MGTGCGEYRGSPRLCLILRFKLFVNNLLPFRQFRIVAFDRSQQNCVGRANFASVISRSQSLVLKNLVVLASLPQRQIRRPSSMRCRSHLYFWVGFPGVIKHNHTRCEVKVYTSSLRRR